MIATTRQIVRQANKCTGRSIAAQRFQLSNARLYSYSAKCLSSTPGSDGLKETLKKLQEENNDNDASVGSKESADEANGQTTDSANVSAAVGGVFSNIFSSIKGLSSSVKEQIEGAYRDHCNASKETNLRRVVQQASSFRKVTPTDGDEDDEAPAYEGPTAMVHVKDPENAWDAMKARLNNSPLIREMFSRAKKVSDAAGATAVGKQANKVGQSVTDKVHDAKEYWETSQNPLVYSVSNVWDSIAGDTEEGLVIAEFLKLDPKFDKEAFLEEARTEYATKLIKAHLAGDITEMKPVLGEGVTHRISSDIAERKKADQVFDPNVLGVDENIVMVKFTESNSPLILVAYMVQQISCVKNRAGDVLLGSESDIRAKFYTLVYQQSLEEDEETGECVMLWKITDYNMSGDDTPYY